MDKQTISFRLDSERVSTLDTLAESLDRDRSYLLNEAVTAYLDVQQWHIDQIKAGIHQADAGTLIDHAKVRKTLGKRQRR
jgi:predicted transcriptional regulator